MTIDASELKSLLSHHTGTEQIFRHTLARGITVQDEPAKPKNSPPGRAL